MEVWVRVKNIQSDTTDESDNGVATFTFEVENHHRHQFKVVISGPNIVSAANLIAALSAVAETISEMSGVALVPHDHPSLPKDTLNG